MRVLRAMVVVAVFGCSVRPADAADIVLGSDATDKVNVQINRKSATPLRHKIQYSAKDTAIDLGSADDPVTNGAAAVVFSAADCQCIVMGQAPGTTPGWTLNGSGTTYRWKDDATGSTAQVKGGKIKFKQKGGITYGLDGTPQGEVEVQVTFGTSADRFCTRFAAPTRPIHDAATSYKSTVFDTGTASCSAVPGFCGPCAPPIPPPPPPPSCGTFPICGGSCPVGHTCQATAVTGQDPNDPPCNAACACVPEDSVCETCAAGRCPGVGDICLLVGPCDGGSACGGFCLSPP